LANVILSAKVGHNKLCVLYGLLSFEVEHIHATKCLWAMSDGGRSGAVDPHA
jgi:hypothetical protein